MRPLLRMLLVTVFLAAAAAAAPPTPREWKQWKQVHPYWRNAYVLSFRSPDLLSNEPDEQWGEDDGRLVSGRILTDFPEWLRQQAGAIQDARADGRPILLSLHVHSGYGVGLITYSPGIHTAQAANYPWLVRQLLDAGLGTKDVTVAVDTCNAQAVAAYQLRTDLFPRGVASWRDFARWRKAAPVRARLPLSGAYRLFAQDHVRVHLLGSARRSRSNVHADPFVPLTRGERGDFHARMYGPHGVILATPTLFNLLRLGPEPRNTMTANLLTGRLDTHWVDAYLERNNAEFRRFREYAFLAAAGDWRDDVAPPHVPGAPTPTAAEPPAIAKAPTPMNEDPRARRIEHGRQ